MDSLTVKAPLEGEATGPNPTNRAKLGTKRHLLTDQRGTPLSVVITKANLHDMKTTTITLNSIVTCRPKPTPRTPQNHYLNKEYDYPEIERAVIKRGYIPPSTTEEKPFLLTMEDPYQAKRWVAERTES